MHYFWILINRQSSGAENEANVEVAQKPQYFERPLEAVSNQSPGDPVLLMPNVYIYFHIHGNCKLGKSLYNSLIYIKS